MVEMRNEAALPHQRFQPLEFVIYRPSAGYELGLVHPSGQEDFLAILCSELVGVGTGVLFQRKHDINAGIKP